MNTTTRSPSIKIKNDRITGKPLHNHIVDVWSCWLTRSGTCCHCGSDWRLALTHFGHKFEQNTVSCHGKKNAWQREHAAQQAGGEEVSWLHVCTRGQKHDTSTTVKERHIIRIILRSIWTPSSDGVPPPVAIGTVCVNILFLFDCVFHSRLVN